MTDTGNFWVISLNLGLLGIFFASVIDASSTAVGSFLLLLRFVSNSRQNNRGGIVARKSWVLCGGPGEHPCVIRASRDVIGPGFQQQC
jgi:hypothetical protein